MILKPLIVIILMKYLRKNKCKPTLCLFTKLKINLRYCYGKDTNIKYMNKIVMLFDSNDEIAIVTPMF